MGSTVVWKPAMMLANVSSSDLRFVLPSGAGAEDAEAAGDGTGDGGAVAAG